MLKIETPKRKEIIANEVSRAPEKDGVRSIEGQKEEGTIDEVTFIDFKKRKFFGRYNISEINAHFHLCRLF